jgi:hypothetical protein
MELFMQDVRDGTNHRMRVALRIDSETPQQAAVREKERQLARLQAKDEGDLVESKIEGQSDIVLEHPDKSLVIRTESSEKQRLEKIGKRQALLHQKGHITD